MSTSKIIKIVLLGSSGAGKSSILHRYVTEEWDDNSQTTLGAAFMDKKIVYEGINFKFQIWDTAGQEKYAPLAQMYYRDANVAVLVFDITSRDSFNSLKEWQHELSEKGPKDITLAIVGNKCDLERYREVPTYEGNQYADACGATFASTSAKQDVGIRELFEEICKKLVKKMNLHSAPKDNGNTKLNNDGGKKPGSGGCCG